MCRRGCVVSRNMKHSPFPVAFPFSSSCGRNTEQLLEEMRTTGGCCSAHIQPKTSPPRPDWLTPADWAVWGCCSASWLADLQFDWVCDCLTDWHTDSLSVWLPVCLSGRPAGWVYLEALMLCWVSSFLTWTHKGPCRQTGLLQHQPPSRPEGWDVSVCITVGPVSP